MSEQLNTCACTSVTSPCTAHQDDQRSQIQKKNGRGRPKEDRVNPEEDQVKVAVGKRLHVASLKGKLRIVLL